ncbi:MAG: hypothetical protein JW861_11170 [Bacteroidales bacterium]|nr:hypothetical protein [Bacteroidales bacterium]
MELTLKPVALRQIILSGILMITTLSAQVTLGQGNTGNSLPEQEPADTLQRTKHSPHKATLYSLVVPGLGQAYNRKYWKIPVIYAGFGTLYYFIHKNDREYQKYREAYYHSLISGDTMPPVNEYESRYDPETLRTAKDYYRRNRDFSIILASLWYLLNVIDATVDAHLFNWDVSEDLTFTWEPALWGISCNGRNITGVRLSLKF